MIFLMDFYWFFSEKPPGNRPSRKKAVLMAKKGGFFTVFGWIFYDVPPLSPLSAIL
jgi:hypothetical protein